jgi:AcrR family transcriptional regulator
MVILMDETVGRREANKRKTRAAIQHAAKQLFARQGYQATTVREIAQAARVTERTFYRYFDGKEGLLAHAAHEWVGRLCDAIRTRPADEPPFTAVQRAMIDIARQSAQDPRRTPIWLFSDEPGALEVLQRSTPRPLLRFENSISKAILDRSKPPHDEDETLAAQLTARISVAVLRTVAIRRRELERTPHHSAPVPGQVLTATLETLRTLVQDDIADT